MYFSKIKSILKNKKGYTDAITVVPIAIAALILIVFFINLASYAQKYLAVKKATDNLLNIICAQGHVTQNIPPYYPGILVDGTNKQDDQYWTRKEMVEHMDDIFKRAGIVNGTTPAYTVRVEFSELEGGGSKTIDNLRTHTSLTDIVAEYGSKITVTVSYDFTWSTGGTSRVAISRVGLSEYSQRTGDWASQ